jgi:hypothetical protein
MCQLGFLLTAQLLQADVPSNILRTAVEDSYVVNLARDVRRRLDSRAGMDLVDSAWFNLQLKERFRDRVRYVVRQCTHYSGAEERLVYIPPPLAYLFLFERPLWLVRRYGWSIAQRLAWRLKPSR